MRTLGEAVNVVCCVQTRHHRATGFCDLVSFGVRCEVRRVGRLRTDSVERCDQGARTVARGRGTLIPTDDVKTQV
jgi:hypothetical protein